VIERQGIQELIRLLEDLVMKTEQATTNTPKASCAFDRKRMELSLASSFVVAPRGMTKEQMKAFIRSKAQV